ncbi:tautomerase family protein [Candidatus Raskinella chloraquaticus]|jgi:4-oxalocrotonate tautomerase|uniref:4-oxalocrotonate tautomerase n=1 Tax=Candidatus Raskinella chloraquaticus TaxID=1951219 RepID=A0A1W9HPU0_9HYPH|nr:MAG: 4-oxalocrotonate tautomerase [Proteobacteria bacterium SG_bin8]
MPLVRISLRHGKPRAYRQAIADQIYNAMRELFEVPPDDIFMTVDELQSENFIYSRTFFDIPRDEDFVIIQITAANTRGQTQKRAFYKGLVARLSAEPGISPDNVMISLVEVGRENWSFGRGVAQYAPG